MEDMDLQAQILPRSKLSMVAMDPQVQILLRLKLSMEVMAPLLMILNATDVSLRLKSQLENLFLKLLTVLILMETVPFVSKKLRMLSDAFLN